MSIIAEEKFKNVAWLTEKHTLTFSQFTLVLGGFLLYGFGINIIECLVFTNSNFMSYFSLLSVQLIASAIAAIGLVFGFIFTSDGCNKTMLFFGYNCLLIPIGFIVFLITDSVGISILYEAALLTSLITVTMCIGATLYSKFFSSLGRFLFFSLLCSSIVEIVAIFAFGFTFRQAILIDVIIFSLYIGFQWAIAMNRPLTVKNALYTAIHLYVDIVMIFLNLIGVKSNSD